MLSRYRRASLLLEVVAIFSFLLFNALGIRNVHHNLAQSGL